jgi:hypothetical protein
VASLDRRSVKSRRAIAYRNFCTERANGTAVRKLDYHDTFLSAYYSHSGDNILEILAMAQQYKKIVMT